MNQTRQWIAVTVLSVSAGFFGGLASMYLHFDKQAASQSPVIRAERFEAVSPSGRTGVLFGFDGRDSLPRIALIGQNGKERIILSVASESEKPYLVMSDETLEGRVVLGYIAPDAPDPNWDDYGLMFWSQQNGLIPDASIGAIKSHTAKDRRFGVVTAVKERGGEWLAPTHAR